MPSGNSPVAAFLPASHRFCRPVEQYRQVPQAGMNEQTTWSPTATRVTPSPDRLDDAGALVPADHGEPHPRVALLDVVVGVAQPGGVELDPHLVGARVVQLELGDLPRPTAARGRSRRGWSCSLGPLSLQLTSARRGRAGGTTTTSRRCPGRCPAAVSTMVVRRWRGPQGFPAHGRRPRRRPRPGASRRDCFRVPEVRLLAFPGTGRYSPHSGEPRSGRRPRRRWTSADRTPLTSHHRAGNPPACLRKDPA